jgi:OOP family OmpA-OmpF porin
MKCLKLLAAAALLFTATTASAQLYFFAGAGGGSVRFKQDDYMLGDRILFRRNDTKDVTYQAGLGYRFNEHWAVEVGAADMGDYSIDQVDSALFAVEGRYTVKGFKTAVVGSYPFTERFSVYGKLGISSTKAEFESTNTGFVGEEKRNSLLAGFGFQYMIWSHLGVRAEYENWGEVGNELDTGRAKLDTVNLQAVFTF